MQETSFHAELCTIYPCGSSQETCRDDATDEQCARCERFSHLLREAVKLYGPDRWGLTPEGFLQEL